ncbi:MAG: hypothetical protein RQ756_09400 [Flavobacteriaceae bacterium]|nr:hypothetical protein [Flavobacteriaceae bacterium]
MKKALVSVLIILGLIMIYLGLKAGMLPPSITGVGFIVIGLLFLIDKK